MTTGLPRKTYEAVHIMFYTLRSVRFISCDGHQLYDFKERGVDLEVDCVLYIEMHRGPHKCYIGPPPSRGGDRELAGGVNVPL